MESRTCLKIATQIFSNKLNPDYTHGFDQFIFKCYLCMDLINLCLECYLYFYYKGIIYILWTDKRNLCTVVFSRTHRLAFIYIHGKIRYVNIY